MKNAYEVLDLTPNATPQEVIRAYRTAAMRWHPDRNRGNEREATLRFKEIGEARLVLCDPTKRTALDAHLAREAERHRHEEAEAKERAQHLRWRKIALEIAEQGRNRDVVVGALLSHGCEFAAAQTIADDALAYLHRQQPRPDVPPSAGAKNEGTAFGIFSVLGLLAACLAVLFLVVRVNTRTEETVYPPISVAQSAELTPRHVATWSKLLPPEAVFDESTGKGAIRYSSLPTDLGFSDEDVSKPFDLEFLQGLSMPGNRQLVLLSSKPDGYGCHACHPLLSAILIKMNATGDAELLIPLQVIGTAGKFGLISLQGDRSVQLLKVGPGREGFVFKDGDGGQGSIVEWGNLFAIEGDRIRALGTFPVREDNMGTGACDGRPKLQCRGKTTTIRFSRVAGPSGYFDIVANEATVDPDKNGGEPVSREYVLRFDGERFAEARAPGAPASVPSATSPSPGSASSAPSPTT